MIRLGVNIDHVATVRQARRGSEPDPVAAALLCELAGADGITVHLRQDRRHIQERDVRILKQTISTTLNLEMALGEGVLDLALELRPYAVCLVPENRQEITTEGGLAVRAEDQAMRSTISRLREAGIQVSLFIEPEPATVRLAQQLGADAIELHTGAWAEAYLAAQGDDLHPGWSAQQRRLQESAETAAAIEAAPARRPRHISYRNVRHLLQLLLLRELNIGHCIISRAVLVGMERAVREMRSCMDQG